MKHKSFIIIFSVIIFACIISAALISNSQKGHTAKISVDGNVIQTINLSDRSPAYDIPIEHDGCRNVVRVENGGIFMLEASCPDKLCVKQGAIYKSGYPIVCLPNKVVISVE